ncbi:putative Serine/threonine protein kinase [Streptomyces viridochromogenes Tue57]|uniref:Putative Serine/threonine protein kinase n=1 Tax=Streptomyces viridochromogenes Tue57 TaxID=1160705 RepID=L8PBH5_STRVR|nr:putative Serine/threonine protein kinase [Streptomyces viridochromogenes Tue57]
MLVQDLQGGAAAERRTAGDQLVEEDSGAVDVDGGRLRAALGGLGRDVRGGADELVGAGQARGVGEAGDAEVGQHRVHPAAVLLQQDVGGLQVAVDDAVGVAGGEGVGDLGGQQGGGDRGEGAVLAQVAVQVGTFDEVHDQGEQIALDDQVADPDDVRVGQAQQDGALPQEPHDDVRVACELLLEDLDRDRLTGLPRHGRLGARGLSLAGSPDGPRGAATERLLEEVLAAYRPHVALPAACLRSDPL